MRPDILTPLFASAANLKGIGQKLDRLLARLTRGAEAASQGARVIDLLLHMPAGTIDRRFRPRLSDLPREGVVTVEARIVRHRPPPRDKGRVPYRVEIADDTGTATLVFFHGHAEHLQRLLPEGETRFISGAVDWYGDEPQLPHPDHIVTASEFERLPLIEPVYPLTAGVPGKLLAKAIRQALDRLPELPEWQDEAFRQRHSWPGFSVALRALHHPESAAAVSADAPPRSRLAYDELLANQLALALVRRHMKEASGRKLAGHGGMRAKLLTALPYSLTRSQESALGEILKDMAAPERMLRLLQGDVGSGKTVIALLAMAAAVEAGYQATLMVPTEILARQHHANLAPLCATAGIRLALLTGREKGRTRGDAVAALAAGDVDILIGTHAIFQEGIEFARLGLAVIDEQHRFGVHQRLALQAKADGAIDLLVMTATPIPRTLALTIYGDMDVSRLTEKPAGRMPIDTRVLPMSRTEEVIEGLGRAIADGQRAYWVCPLVEDSEAIDLAAAEERHESLAKRFPGRTGLVHGRMKGTERDAVMAAFKSGAISLLVATTVIEVGVDVPEAGIMVVENAERFGLAQLHQLRGRVGRGTARSSCLLLYQEPLGPTAKARLQTLRDTDDGFVIAEQDLKLRGAGEMLGVRQSGLPDFHIADLAVHGGLLQAAHDDASLILARDPDLAGSRGEALRVLLYLFERDAAVRLIASG